MPDVEQPMMVIRKKLAAAEFSPANKRYVLETDMVQSSPDGGVTWYDDPAADPRHNDANRLPPRTGTDRKCDAAEAMVQHFKFQVDAFIAGGSILAVVNVWIGLLFFIPGVNIIVAILFAIADALFTTGVVAIEAAMTETVYNQIKCILYCYTDADGQMSAAQLTSVYAQVEAQIGGVAATVFLEVTRAWGEVGFSNAGASGEFVGDCDACSCLQCYHWDFTITDGEYLPGYPGFAPPAAYISDWVDGEGWKPSGGPPIYNGFYRDFDPIEVLDLRVHWVGGDESMGACGNISAELYLAGVQQAVVSTDQSWATTGELHIAGSYTADRIIVSGNNCTNAPWAFDWAEIYFNGDPVFGEDNCS